MTVVYELGAVWLVRDDGWRYRLDGVTSLSVDQCFYENTTTVTAHISRLTKDALQTLSVLLEVAEEHNFDLAVETN